MTDVFLAGGAEMVLLGTVLLLVLVEALWPQRAGGSMGYLALSGVALAFMALTYGSGSPPEIFGGGWANDQLAVIFKVSLLLATALVLFISTGDVNDTSRASGEFYILLLLGTLGMMIMVSGRDLLVIYLGLELMAISFYILAGFYWFREAASEGALKYVLTGLVASALLLYGISFLYGVSGTTLLHRMDGLMRVGGRSEAMVLVGIALVACGLAFKMGATPFHMWMPDVLEGSPTSVAAYLTVGPKIAVIAVAIRIFLTALPSWHGPWESFWWSLAALTILWGNLAALAQMTIKRLLAYSSIAHVGYLLMALVAAGRETEEALGAITFYLVVYVLMNLGAFGSLLWFERRTGEEITWKGLGGMHRQAPVMSVLLSLFMLSLAGIPPTAGFIGKLWVFMACWKAEYYGLVMIGVAGSLIGASYYLRVVYALFMLPEPEGKGIRLGFSPLVYAVVVTALGVIAVGFYPRLVMPLAGMAVLN
jgi:NADH-quinone oxidoreductase subunit N